MNRLSSTIRRPTGQIFAANVVAQGLGLGIVLISASALSPSDFSRLTALLIWGAILPAIGAWTLADAMLRNAHSPESIATVYSSGSVILLVCSTLASGCMYVIGIEVIGAPKLEAIFAAGLVLLTILSTWFLGLEQRLRRFGRFNRLTVLSNAGALLLAAVSLTGMAGTNTVSYLLAARILPYLLLLGSQAIKRRQYLQTPSRRCMRDLLQDATGMHGSSVLSVLSSRIEQVVATYYLSHVNMGALGVMLPFANATRTVGRAVSTTQAVDIAENRDANIKRIWIGTLKKCLYGSSLVGVLLYAGVFVSWQMTDTFPPVGGWLAAGLSILAAVLVSSSEAIIRLQKIRGRYLPGVLARLASLSVGVVGSLTLIENFQLVGMSLVAMGSSLTLFLFVLGDMWFWDFRMHEGGNK